MASRSEVVLGTALHRLRLLAVRKGWCCDSQRVPSSPRGAALCRGPLPLSLQLPCGPCEADGKHGLYPRVPESAGAGASPRPQGPACSRGPLGTQGEPELPKSGPERVEARPHPVGWPWASYITSLSPGFFICKMGLLIVPRPWGDWVLGQAWHVLHTRQTVAPRAAHPQPALPALQHRD